MCILKDAPNKENAEAFINFMCSTEAGLQELRGDLVLLSPAERAGSALDPEVSYPIPTPIPIEEHHGPVRELLAGSAPEDLWTTRY